MNRGNTEALELKPNWEYPYNNRGNAYLGLKQYERAIQDYDKAIQLNPNYVNAIYWRGKCDEALGDEVKAQADFAKAKELGYNG